MNAKDTVLRFLQLMGTGVPEDQEQAGGMFSEDAEFWILGTGTVRGRSEIMEKRFRPGRSTMVPGSKTLKVGAVVTEGEFVAAEWMSHRKVVNAPDYKNLFFGLFRVQNGEITMLREYRDTLVATAAHRPGTHAVVAESK